MYLQGGAIWHPRCGPGPTEDGRILNGTGEANGNCTDTEVSMREFDRNSTSGVSELQVSSCNLLSISSFNSQWDHECFPSK